MRVGLSSILVLALIQLSAQGKMVFEEKAFDFGQINEIDGIAEHIFTFTNQGDDSLRIRDVKATCGCTVPKWSNQIVYPGDIGQITIQYNTYNRPGNFNKSVQVISNREVENVTLSIAGHVLPRPKSIEDELPVLAGSIRIENKGLLMGKITTEKPVAKSFKIFNEASSVLFFDSSRILTPQHMVLNIKPMTLPSNGEGVITIQYDPNLKNELGYQVDPISIFAMDEQNPVLVLNVVATIEEHFPMMTKDELVLAPRLSVSDKVLSLGKVSQGDTISGKFSISNNGKSDLLIRSLLPNCECVDTRLDSRIIAPGKEIELEIFFNTSGRRGRQYKNVTIFSNDPKAPARIVTIRADVEVIEN